MAKRFIDTGMFSDSWFCELKPTTKLFYIYCITKCDHAGIIDLNLRLAEFETGFKGLANSIDTLSEELGNRFVRLRDNYYMIPKFIGFQYPKGLNPNVKPQKAVITRLAEFGLDFNSYLTVTEELDNSSSTVQDKDKDKDIEIDKERAFTEFWDLYPRKVSKSKAKEKFKSHYRVTRPTEMIDALKKYLELGLFSTDITKVAFASTWIHQERYKDDFDSMESEKEETFKDGIHIPGFPHAPLDLYYWKGDVYESNGTVSKKWFWDTSINQVQPYD